MTKNSPWHDKSVSIMYPEDRTVSGDTLYGWYQDAIANGDMPKELMPQSWAEALELAEDYLDVTLRASQGYDKANASDMLYQAQYAYACGYYD